MEIKTIVFPLYLFKSVYHLGLPNSMKLFQHFFDLEDFELFLR